MKELSAARIEQLSTSEISDALDALGWQMPQPADDDLEENLERLQTDYCQLLIGPKGHVSPIESVWTADQFQSPSVDKMKSFFDLLPNYQPPDRFHDHIGVQLDFAGHLLLAADQETDNAPGTLDHADDLLKTYVQRRLVWTRPMLKKVQQQAQTGFYVQLSSVTQEWIRLFQPKPTS